MAYARSVAVPFTTDAGGDAVVHSGVNVNGRVIEVVYTYGDAATGADFTIVGRTTGKTILTITNAGVSNITWRPRGATHNTTGAAAEYAAGFPVLDPIWVVDEEIKVTVAQGGDTKTGTLTFIIG